jgi:hypothetical protein
VLELTLVTCPMLGFDGCTCWSAATDGATLLDCSVLESRSSPPPRGVRRGKYSDAAAAAATLGVPKSKLDRLTRLPRVFGLGFVGDETVDDSGLQLALNRSRTNSSSSDSLPMSSGDAGAATLLRDSGHGRGEGGLVGLLAGESSGIPEVMVASLVSKPSTSLSSMPPAAPGSRIE